MVVFLVLAVFFIMILVDVIFIFPRTKRGKEALERKPEFFYHPEVGVTMADGGELIKEKNGDNKSE